MSIQLYMEINGIIQDKLNFYYEVMTIPCVACVRAFLHLNGNGSIVIPNSLREVSIIGKQLLIQHTAN